MAKTCSKRVISAVLCMIMLIGCISGIYISNAEGMSTVPKAVLKYDNDTQSLLVLQNDGSYATSENFTATFVGEGAKFDEEGFLSAHSLRFNDMSSYLKIEAKNNTKLVDSDTGVTVSLWMKETRETYNSSGGGQRPDVRDPMEQMLTTISPSGKASSTCVDDIYYFADGTNNKRWYQFCQNYLAEGAAKREFVEAMDWTSYIAVITSTSVRLYRNGKLQYNFTGSSALKKGNGTGTAPKISDFTAAFFEGLTASNGVLFYRYNICDNRGTDSLRMDGLSVYNTAMSDSVVKDLYEEQMNSFVTVTYDNNYEETLDTESLKNGDIPTLPTLTRTGYVFENWYTDKECTTLYVAGPVTQNITLYAKWTANEYAIEYELNGGALESPAVTYTPAAPVTLPIPAREHYVFTGWFRTPELKGIITKTYPEQIGDIKVYAGWEAVEYSVNYDTAGGINNSNNPTTLTADDGTVTLENAVKKDYIFDGWYIGDKKVKEISVTGDTITLTAKWREIKEPCEVFTDVKHGAWYEEYVKYAYNYGLFNGVTESTFEPQTAMSRAMFVTVLARIKNIEVDNSVSTKFADVPANRYYTGAVEWAAKNGVVMGVSETEFAPDTDITREQMCVLLVRFANTMEVELEQKLEQKTFADDASISKYAKEAVYICQRAGIIRGKTETEFSPKEQATRAQVATILTTYCKECVK